MIEYVHEKRKKSYTRVKIGKGIIIGMFRFSFGFNDFMWLVNILLLICYTIRYEIS